MSLMITVTTLKYSLYNGKLMENVLFTVKQTRKVILTVIIQVKLGEAN